MYGGINIEGEIFNDVWTLNLNNKEWKKCETEINEGCVEHCACGIFRGRIILENVY